MFSDLVSTILISLSPASTFNPAEVWEKEKRKEEGGALVKGSGGGGGGGKKAQAMIEENTANMHYHKYLSEC